MEVYEHGVAVITAYGADNNTVTYTIGDKTESGVVYKVVGEDENGQPVTFVASAAAEADDVNWGRYNVVVDPSGAMDITPAGE